MSIRSLPVQLLSTTLCVAVALAGCTTHDASSARRAPEPDRAAAPIDDAVAAPIYDYTADERDGRVVYTAYDGDVTVATMAVDVGGKVLTFDRGRSHMTMRFRQDEAGRLEVSGDANGQAFSLTMLPDRLDTLVVTGGGPEVTAVFKEVAATFGDHVQVAAVSRSCWWDCLGCAAELIAVVGAGIALLWPVIVPLTALIAEVGWAAFGALTATEVAGLLGISAELASAILGPCLDCIQCLMA